MPLEVQSQLIELNQTGLFTFTGPVSLGNYVVGNSLMSLFYPNLQAFSVRNISISLAHGLQNANTVYVTVSGNMSDDSGHGADGSSRCIVTVVAWVGTTSTPTLVMGNFTGISASLPRTFTAPANAQQIFTFLSGLNIELNDSEGVTSYSASTSSDYNAIDGMITIGGDAQLNGIHGTVDVGVIVVTALDAGYQIFTASCPATTDDCSIPVSPPVNAVAAAMASFGGEFSHGAVVLMAASVDVDDIDPPLPVSAFGASFDVEIVSKSGGTEHPNVNACFIGINGSADVADTFLPTRRAQRLRTLAAARRSPA